MGEHPALWEQLGDEAAANELPTTPKELRNFPLAEAMAAYACLEDQRPLGKVVLLCGAEPAS